MKQLFALCLVALMAAGWVLVNSTKTDFVFSLTRHKLSVSVRNEGSPKPSAPAPFQSAPTGGAAPFHGSTMPEDGAHKPFLGVTTVSAGLVAGLHQHEGAAVVQVIPGSPAANAGLLPGDRIIQAGGSPIATSADLRGVVRSSQVGRPLVLRVWRGYQPFVCVADLAAASAPLPARPVTVDLGG